MSPFLLRGSRAYIVLCLYGCNVLSGFVQKVSSRGNFFDLVPGHFILQPQGRQRRKSLGTMVFCAVFIDFRVLYICFFQMKTDSKYLLTKRADFYLICYSLTQSNPSRLRYPGSSRCGKVRLTSYNGWYQIPKPSSAKMHVYFYFKFD